MSSCVPTNSIISVTLILQGEDFYTINDINRGIRRITRSIIGIYTHAA
jgi:hypothetical protein